jgi:hypothetical protein
MLDAKRITILLVPQPAGHTRTTGDIVHTEDSDNFPQSADTVAPRKIGALRLLAFHLPAEPARRHAPRRRFITSVLFERRHAERRRGIPGIDGLLRMVLADRWK